MNENAQRERDSELLVKWEVVLLMLETTNRRHWAPGGPNRATHHSCPGKEMEREDGQRAAIRLLELYCYTNQLARFNSAQRAVGGEGQSC